MVDGAAVATTVSQGESITPLPAKAAPKEAGATLATQPARAPVEAEPVDTSHPDRRQDAKIARGLSASPLGGVLVTAVPPGSVTGQLHLQAGDIIVAVNGEAVSSPGDFARLYREHGLPTELTVIRDGRELHRH
jgi:S1-C subfamily serine protease